MGQATERVSKQVIVMRNDLNMPRGKMCAQSAHASLAAYKSADTKSPAFKDWNEGRFTKICLRVTSEQELIDLYNKLKSAGLNVVLITDAGLTMFNGVPTKTCLAVGPHWAEEIDPITSSLKLL